MSSMVRTIRRNIYRNWASGKFNNKKKKKGWLGRLIDRIKGKS